MGRSNDVFLNSANITNEIVSISFESYALSGYKDMHIRSHKKYCHKPFSVCDFNVNNIKYNIVEKESIFMIDLIDNVYVVDESMEIKWNSRSGVEYGQK